MTNTLAQPLAEQLRRGTFTHLYASCGLLAEPTPRHVFTHLPDNRNIFDLASLTKALVTLPLYSDALLANKLQLNTTLGTLLQNSPYQLTPMLAQLRIEELLCHRSRLPAWRNFWIGTLGTAHTLTTEEVIARLNRSATHLTAPQPCYSDLNFILAALALEIFADKPLATMFSSLCQDQLNFTPQRHFGFRPQQCTMTIPTAYCNIRKRLLQGEVHDENCAALGGISGHAGLFGSGDDLVAYLRHLYSHKIGQQILHLNEKMLTTTPHTCLFGMQRGANGVLSAQGTLLGHLGFTGTSFWIDPQHATYAVLLTNRTITARLVPDFNQFRQQVYSALQTYLTT